MHKLFENEKARDWFICNPTGHLRYVLKLEKALAFLKSRECVCWRKDASDAHRGGS